LRPPQPEPNEVPALTAPVKPPPSEVQDSRPEGEEKNPSAQAAEPPPPPAPEEEAAGDETAAPGGNLESLANDILEASSNLSSAYKDFLGEKEDAGSELTPADDQLEEELSSFEDAADGLYKGAKAGFISRFRRLRGENPEAAQRRVGQRFVELKRAERKVDELMLQVQPSPKVRQLWRQIRQQIRQVGALARS